jgi:hypothetical protein
VAKHAAKGDARAWVHGRSFARTTYRGLMPFATVLPFEKAYMPVGAAPSPQAELIVVAGHGKRGHALLKHAAGKSWRIVK